MGWDQHFCKHRDDLVYQSTPTWEDDNIDRRQDEIGYLRQTRWFARYIMVSRGLTPTHRENFWTVIIDQEMWNTIHELIRVIHTQDIRDGVFPGMSEDDTESSAFSVLYELLKITHEHPAESYDYYLSM